MLSAASIVLWFLLYFLRKCEVGYVGIVTFKKMRGRLRRHNIPFSANASTYIVSPNHACGYFKEKKPEMHALIRL
jgi:hypothetical protein